MYHGEFSEELHNLSISAKSTRFEVWRIIDSQMVLGWTKWTLKINTQKLMLFFKLLPGK